MADETTDVLDELSFSHARLTELGIPSHHEGRELALWDRIALLIGFEPQPLPVPSERSRPVQPVAEELLRVALHEAPPHQGRPLLNDALDHLRKRHAFGVRKYGRKLVTWNGRDAGEDAQHEAGDFPNYCAQAAMEHADEGDAEGAALWSLLGCEAASLLGRVMILRRRPVQRGSGAASMSVDRALGELRALMADVTRGGAPGRLFVWQVRQLLFSAAGAFGIGNDEAVWSGFRERAARLRELTARDAG